MEYTKPQHEAVYGHFDQDVLVSASAGSGKTRVLVDRVINKLLNDHINIDEMLILTFTNAAAKEMRDRIQTALRDQLNNADDNDVKAFLIKQLRRLPVSDISTLDAFCQKIVQNYYYIINLDPNFRLLADQTESQMLKEQVWENVREDLYANDKDGSFAQLTENFSDDRSDDGLTNLVFKTYDYANVNQDPVDWLKKTPAIYDIDSGSITASDFYQKHLLSIIKNEVQQQKLSFAAAKNIAEDNSLGKIVAVVQNDIDNMDNLIELLSSASWDKLQTAFNDVKFKTFPRKSKDEDKATHDRVKNIRDGAKKAFQKLPNKYFALNEADNLKIMTASKQLVDKLVRVVLTFSDSYQQAKLKRHALEFIDVEHYAYDILSGQDDKSKGIREILQNQYNEIMIDEYQDNNQLQDAIVKQIAKTDSSNMFMVGDVKQSIYRFRLADPSLFIHRMEDPAEGTIVLPDNFRSAKNIDDFINLIFTQIMDKQVGEIDYTGDAKLKAGAKYPDDLKSNVEVLMYESTDDDQEAVDEQFQIQDSAHGQIEIVAQKIDEMISKQMPIYDRRKQVMRSVEYSDIAIISSTRNNNLVLSDIFGGHNIPLIVNGAQSYFKTTEIQIMMALLSIIDNPYQDIPLVAVLRSPIVGLNENQLAYLRINAKTGDYFNAVLKFMYDYSNMQQTEFGDQVFAKVKTFLDQLTEFRDIAQQHEIVDLIWHIYQSTGFLDYVGGMPAGKQRQANLHALYERAFDYERTSFKGLFQFVRFVRRMQERNEDLDEANADENTNAVSVMTIHGSKGLEFPVVFLLDASHGFNQQDSKKPYVLNDKLGLGITYLDSKYRVKEDTLQRQVVNQMENQGLLAEEMRKLYVALTRAEQQLFIVGATKSGNDQTKIIDNWNKSAHDENVLLDNSLRSGAKSYLDWIGPALVRHPRFRNKFGDDTMYRGLDNDETNFDVSFYNQNDLSKNIISGDQSINRDWLEHFAKIAKDKPVPKDINVDDIDQIMNFVYPNTVATQTTAYQSVSEIKRLFEDPDNITLGNYDKDWQENKQSSRYVNSDFNKPKFMQSVSQPSPADVGTATHLILQELDLSHLPQNNEVQTLIERLVTDQVLTKEVASKIDVDEVIKLFDTDLGETILENYDHLSREASFSMLMDANLVFKGFDEKNDEKILIHGIIDGYLEFEDHILLFDYKTDYIGQRNTEQQVNKIIEKYRGQINLYATALEKITNKPVTDKYLYLLSINSAEKID
ncbi:helicase-exonuclease AddAB subunit AddA [Apilactobacillus apisilvae]|uniref:ATP-dependent helicase/nuclease subunit A n=1 Tax=Apilactobacillus apisilvae TaxID=2923364 RepID=A0ABY4PH46_9LACO|nr:helicase-exonuclease AddAB subunit AddA [Apilactobacillus apisilvae]UQS84781.1 helicase-exonuclease AddAB subunit AddA [Apilactobacillus apisilvae]